MCDQSCITMNLLLLYLFHSTKILRMCQLRTVLQANLNRLNRRKKASQETYYENQYYLYGSANGDVEVPSGETNYPFSCQIPPTAPSSFEGEFGHIRYTVKAVLDRPWKFNSEAKAAFIVVAPLDLNGLPQAKQPVLFEKSKNFCCLWCKSGPLTLTIKLPTSGYVPGQTIPFQIEIENGSNIPVRPINCES